MNRPHSGARFLHYLKSYTFLILLATFCALVIAVGELGYVHILADTIDALKLIERHNFDQNPLTVHYFQLNVIGIDNTLNVQKSAISFFNGLTFSITTQKEALRLVGIVLGWILGLVLIKGVFAYLNDFLMRCVGLKLIVRLRNELYHKMVMAPLGTLHQYRLGDLLSRLTDDVRSLQAAIGSTASVVRALIYVPVFVLVMLVRSFSLTIFALLVLPPLGYLINRFGQRIRHTSREIQQQTADLSSQVKETLTGIEIIKSFRAESKEMQKFTNTTQQQYRLSMQRTRLSAMLPPLVEIISVIGISTVFGLGCWQVIEGRLSTGWFIGYISMISLMFKPLRTIGQFNIVLQQSLASAERIFQILDFSEEKDGSVELHATFPSSEFATTKSGQVVFRNVSFRYRSGELVLHDINLEAGSGETVALIGSSGSGKTSLINLIPRFITPFEGQILIDGQDISDLTLDSLRQQISIVTQETILFDGTVLENIGYGNPNATETEAIAASVAANADKFIQRMPKGYQTQIRENGRNLSGGEKQRIAIARAMLKDPQILLLDEATSNLDNESEALVQASLADLMVGQTTFVIAHRLSTVVNASQILVLDQGKIVEHGTHHTLLQQGGRYAQQYQLGLAK